MSLNRVWVQHKRGRTAARNRLLRVHEMLDDSLLPLDRPAINGSPGSGEQWAAYKRVLTPKPLVMALPAGSDKIVHLDADCYQVWDALRRYYSRTL